MLQFNAGFYRIGSNVAHKVRRYIQLFVASELVSDVEWFPLTRTPVTRTNNKPIRLRRIPALLALASCGYLEEGLYERL